MCVLLTVTHFKQEQLPQHDWCQILDKRNYWHMQVCLISQSSDPVAAVQWKFTLPPPPPPSPHWRFETQSILLSLASSWLQGYCKCSYKKLIILLFGNFKLLQVPIEQIKGVLKTLCVWTGWEFDLRKLCVSNSTAGCKENHFYSLPLRQAEASI